MFFSQMWITNSAEAEIFLVFATVDPSKGYKGITCFLVEKDMGIQIAKKEQKVCLPLLDRDSSSSAKWCYSSVSALHQRAHSTSMMCECLLPMSSARSEKATRSLSKF
jgi:hypothetical protein